MEKSGVIKGLAKVCKVLSGNCLRILESEFCKVCKMYEETLVIRNKSEYLITEFDNGAKDMSETFGMGIW